MAIGTVGSTRSWHHGHRPGQPIPCEPPPGASRTRGRAPPAHRCGGARPLPYLLIAPAIAVLGRDARLPARAGSVVLSLQEFGLRAAVRHAAPLGRAGQLSPRSSADSYFWDVLWRTVVFCLVERGAHDDARPAGRAAAARRSAGDAAAGERRPAAGLGDARRCPPPSCGSGCSTRSTASSNWLLTTLGIGDFQGHSWLSEPIVVLHGGHDHRGLDGHPVRRLHAVRRPDPGAAGHRRGGRHRRRRRRGSGSGRRRCRWSSRCC